MGRNLSLSEDCLFVRLHEGIDLRNFSCGDDDLDDFFRNNALQNAKQRLGTTYVVHTRRPPYRVVAMVTLANDSIKSALITKSARNKLQRPIPHAKRHRSYPGVLIGRLGVATAFQGMHLGAQLLDYLKYRLTLDRNLAACRFLLVDAYNNEHTLQFYIRNGFTPLYATESLEREAFDVPQGEGLRARMMYLDLGASDMP